MSNAKADFDSRGVTLRAFDGTNKKDATRYKLFNKPELRQVVFQRLRHQLAASNACRPDASIELCLACGRIAGDSDRKGLHLHFAAQGWSLWDEPWLQERLQHMSDRGYENQVSAVVAKLLLRGKVE